MQKLSNATATATARPEDALEQHRPRLTGYCYRMLGSPFEAEDAVQETMVRAWRGIDRLEGRDALKSWLYRIATNVCFDMLAGRRRRARPMDLGPSSEPVADNLRELPEATWIAPIPDSLIADPADVATQRETVRLAFVAALQELPPLQRGALILCEVLHWRAAEAAELLDTSVPAVNSALQRARATLQRRELDAELHDGDVGPLDVGERDLLERYVDAFQRYDVDALTALLHEDVTQSMPPYDLWLRGRDDVLAWWFGPGSGCRGSRVLAAPVANGCSALGQYRPDDDGGHSPWALQVLRSDGERILEVTHFLDCERLFELFGLPPHLPAAG